MENEYYSKLPKKRMGVGALLFNESNELLIVKPTYKDHWTIPGGVVDENESPRQACLREIKEELGLEISQLTFICVDYVSTTKEKSENLQFIFSGGVLTDQPIYSIKLQRAEIAEYKFLALTEALPLLSEKLAKRIPKCLQALETETSLYFENGI